MTKITSAYANKLLRSLEEEKDYLINKEAASITYVVANNEEPVVPEYDYMEMAAQIAETDEKIAVIRHALNLSNAAAKVQVGNEILSVDTILIKMAQLNKRKNMLDYMRKQLPKSRENRCSTSGNSIPEYRYINYNLAFAKSEYERVSKEIMEMQMALDYYNQTVQFEVEL